MLFFKTISASSTKISVVTFFSNVASKNLQSEVEKLEGDGFINGQQDFAVQELRLQRDYWIKKLCTIYPYGLNERAKNSNLEQPTGKLLSLPRVGNRQENLEKRRANEPTKFDTTDTLSAHTATFAPKTRSDNFRRILGDLRKLASNATD